ncbi:HNH endonuclease [Shouchella miscanthi]|uniref:HNH endonuclease n=1 Tax=Shouchella miscanthi TaxID=2598861 RepID=UPI0011AA9209|nr:HNH endonuclease [Shouchella miscanthi]
MGLPIEKQTFYSITIGKDIHDITGRKRTRMGYVVLLIKTHPNGDVSGYVMEHRVIMEHHLGRYLKSDEVVHHLNEIKHDNRLTNLEVMNHTDHTVMHHTGLKRSEETRKKISKKARQRYKDRKDHPFYKDVDEQLKQFFLMGKKPTEISRLLGISRRSVYNKISYLNLKEDNNNAQ